VNYHLQDRSGGASPVFVAGHRQVISRISKGNQNIVVGLGLQNSHRPKF